MSEMQLDLFGPPAGAPQRVLVFDLETQKSFAEVGGRDNFRDLKISVAATMELPGRRTRTYHEWDLARLVEALHAADLVVGFNIRRFDYEVLSAYTDRRLGDLPTLDLLEKFESAAGFRVKLDSIAKATLGRSKSGDGLEAIRWFKEGKLDQIAQYCCDDVAITADLYLFGKEKGYVLYPDRRGETRTCRISW